MLNIILLSIITVFTFLNDAYAFVDPYWDYTSSTDTVELDVIQNQIEINANAHFFSSYIYVDMNIINHGKEVVYYIPGESVIISDIYDKKHSPERLKYDSWKNPEERDIISINFEYSYSKSKRKMKNIEIRYVDRWGDFRKIKTLKEEKYKPSEDNINKIMNKAITLFPSKEVKLEYIFMGFDFSRRILLIFQGYPHPDKNNFVFHSGKFYTSSSDEGKYIDIKFIHPKKENKEEQGKAGK